MAGKNKGDNGGGQSNRFRFVMFEGELSEGNMGALAQAITSALRPAAPPAPPRITNRAAPALGAGNGAGDAAASAEADGEEIAAVENGEEPAESAPAAKPKSSAPRTYPKGKVLNDVDLESDVSFPDFAAGKKPKNIQDRYLIAAAWYKLHRNTGAITMHHVYTCFLHPKVKWPTTAADFDQPLRQLVKANRMDRGDRGQYVINTIGLADVVALGGE